MPSKYHDHEHRGYRHRYDVRNSCFTYRLDAVIPFGYSPVLKWRWFVAGKDVFFARVDVGTTLFGQCHSQKDSYQEDFGRYGTNKITLLLKRWCPGYQGRAAEFLSANSGVTRMKLISLKDVSSLCRNNFHGRHNLSCSRKLPLRKPGSKPLTQAKVMRWALWGEIKSGRFIEAIKQQSVFFQDQEQEQANQQHQSKTAKRRTRKNKPAFSSKADLASLAAAALCLTPTNN